MSSVITQEQYDTLGTTLFVIANEPDHQTNICGSCGGQALYAPCRFCGVTWTRVTNLFHVSGWTDDDYRTACQEKAHEIIRETTYVQRRTLLPEGVWPFPQYRGQMTITG